MKDTDLITVCDSCLRASCFQGIHVCQNWRSAGITQKTVKELRELNRESPEYWKESIVESNRL